MSDNVKVGILARALPEDLKLLNVFQFNNNWKECCSYVKRLIPDIAYSKLKKRNLKAKSQKIYLT